MYHKILYRYKKIYKTSYFLIILLQLSIIITNIYTLQNMISVKLRFYFLFQFSIIIKKHILLITLNKINELLLRKYKKFHKSFHINHNVNIYVIQPYRRSSDSCKRCHSRKFQRQCSCGVTAAQSNREIRILTRASLTNVSPTRPQDKRI